MLIDLSFLILIAGVGYMIILELFVIRPRIAKFPTPETEKMVRKEVTRNYLLGISRSNFLIIIVALATALIGAYSAQISLQERNETNLYDELSVQPHLDISFYINSTTPGIPSGVGYAVNSDGLGPAIIKWARVYANGTEVENWSDANALMGYPETVNYTYSNPNPGSILKVGDIFATYSVPPGPDAEYLAQNAGKIEITVCYCSIYAQADSSQCWQASNIKTYIKLGCDTQPTTILEGDYPNLTPVSSTTSS